MASAAMSPYESLFRLDGRRALVVGAGSGIGAEAARGLAAFGAEVVCADRNAPACASVADEIGGSSLTLDLNDPSSIADAASALASRRLHIVVTTPSINVRKRIVDYDDDELDRVVDLNLKGTFRVCRTFGAMLADGGGGSLIGFTSIRSVTTEPGQGAYAATKAATVMLFKTLAAELGSAGVRANTIAPGIVDTPLTAQIKAQPAWQEAYADKPIIKRWATPSELVGAVVYLASDASSYVTGSTLFVDGGWTAVDGRFEPDGIQSI